MHPASDFQVFQSERGSAGWTRAQRPQSSIVLRRGLFQADLDPDLRQSRSNGCSRCPGGPSRPGPGPGRAAAAARAAQAVTIWLGGCSSGACAVTVPASDRLRVPLLLRVPHPGSSSPAAAASRPDALLRRPPDPASRGGGVVPAPESVPGPGLARHNRPLARPAAAGAPAAGFQCTLSPPPLRATPPPTPASSSLPAGRPVHL